MDYSCRAMELWPKPKYGDAPGTIAQIAEIRGGYALAIGMRETCMEILRKDWQVTKGELLETYRREEQNCNMTDTAGDFNLRRCFTSATACVHPFFSCSFLAIHMDKIYNKNR